jgi:hypothetical protein
VGGEHLAQPAVVALIRRLSRLPTTQLGIGLRHLEQATEDEVSLDRHRLLAHNVPSLSNTATRSSTGTPSDTVRSTNSTIARLAAPSLRWPTHHFERSSRSLLWTGHVAQTLSRSQPPTSPEPHETPATETFCVRPVKAVSFRHKQVNGGKGEVAAGPRARCYY